MSKAPTDIPPLSPLVFSVFDGFLKKLEDLKTFDADTLARLKKSLVEDQESGHVPLRTAMFGDDGAAE